MHRNNIKREGFLRDVFFASGDLTGFLGSISKLAQHLQEPIVFTGSVATSRHLLQHGILGEKRLLNDIDIVIEGPSGLPASLCQDFLIAHFHPLRERGKILAQLIDEEHATRIDVFTPGSRSLAERLIDSAIGNVPCKFVSAEDLSAKLLSIIYPVIRGEPVETKYVEHFRSLSAIVDLGSMGEVWPEYKKESQSLDYGEAAEAVWVSITANPGLLQVSRYSQDISQACAWCCESELFPLAARSRIHEVLGYV